MTLFEYLAIAFSLVFSFSAMRLVSGLPHALMADRRYWVHLVLVVVQLLSTAVVFWAFWSFRKVEWDFPSFMVALANPSLIYFNSCALMPESPASVESWRDYYYAVRLRYYLGVCSWCVVVAAGSVLVMGLPILHPTRFGQLTILAVAILGATSKKPRVHEGIALFFLVLTPLVIFLLFSRADPLR